MCVTTCRFVWADWPLILPVSESFAHHEGNYAVIESLLDESKLFIEWTAREAEIDIAAELVDLHIRLACWQRRLPRLWKQGRKGCFFHDIIFTDGQFRNIDDIQP